jgi:RNA polymerase sigma factor (TIGR02999 family)
MRRILVERARSKGRKKRSGGRLRFNIDDADAVVNAAPDQLLAINEAIERLELEDAEVFELVRLRYFAGLSMAQAAAAIGISKATAYRHWNYARAWLHSELLGCDGP